MATMIRTATLDDQAVLTDFGRRAFEETFASQNAPENMDAYLTAAFNAERQTEELADTDRVTLVAECAGVLVGYAQIHRSDVPWLRHGAQLCGISAFLYRYPSSGNRHRA